MIRHKTYSRFLAIFLSLILVIGMMPVTVFAVQTIPYLDENGDSVELAENYVLINDTNVSDTWNTGWYVVDGDVNIGSRVTVTGNVNLILKNNASLTVTGGISVLAPNSFTVYAQSTNDDMGRLTTQSPDSGNAGIGGTNSADAGTITINGGFVDVNGTGNGTYGIGSGINRGCGTITINNGHVSVDRGGLYSGGWPVAVEYNGGGIGASSGTCDVVITGGTVEIIGDLMSHGNGIGGKLSTGENGTAVLYAHNGAYGGEVITDRSDSENWDILLCDWGQATAYGDVTLQEDLSLPTDIGKLIVKGSLTIPSGVELTIGENSELNNEGRITVQDGGTLTIVGTVSQYGDLIVNQGGIVNKGQQNAPEAPSVTVQDEDSITISSTVGQKYACSTVNQAPELTSSLWQTASGDSLTFDNLTPGTHYYLYTYIASSDYYQDSPVSPATETYTFPKLIISADITSYVQVGEVSIQVESTEAAEVYVKKGNYDYGQWEKVSLENGTGTYEVNQNDSYFFAAVISGNPIDNAPYQSVVFSHIDSTKPEVQLDSGTYTSGTWTNQDVTLSVSNATTANLGTTTFQYRVNNGGWQDYDEPIIVSEETDSTVYTFKAISASGVESDEVSITVKLDRTAPTVSRVLDKATYYTTQTFTVSDPNLESVTVDGQAVAEPYTLEGNQDAVYTIVAADQAGNSTTYQVTMKTIASLGTPIQGITVDNVTAGNKASIEAVKAEIEAVNTEYATEDEKAELDQLLKNCNALLATIEESTQGGNTEIIDKVENITSDNVKPEDKEDLTAAKEDLENALENFGGNYTEEEKAALEEKLEQINNALESIEKAETVRDAITALPDAVEPDDIDAETLINVAKEQYDQLTEHEKSLISEELKAKLERLLDNLIDYQIIESNGNQWIVGDDGSITMTANGSVEKFVGIEVDGKTVDAANYTVKSGSTIITLKPDYLDTLSVGKHTLTVLYTDGETSGEFEIVKDSKTTIPGTGDNSNIPLWVVILLVSGSVLGTITIKKKKQSN